MKIEKTTNYTVNGINFPSLEKAEDHVEGLFAQKLSDKLMKNGFTANEAFKVCQIVLDNRDEFLPFLNCKFEDDEKPYGFNTED